MLVVREPLESALGNSPGPKIQKKGVQVWPPKKWGQKPPALQIVLGPSPAPPLPWPCLREDG